MIKDFFKKILGITELEKQNEVLRSKLQYHESFVNRKVAELKEYTRVDADIGMRGNNTIILTGVYRKRAFVKFYDLDGRDFSGMVEQMRSMKDHCLVRNIDAPVRMQGMFDLMDLKE